MVRIEDYAGPSRPPKSKGQTAQKKDGREAETDEGVAPPVGLAPAVVSSDLPPVGNRPAASGSLPMVPVSAGRAILVEEEEEEVLPPLKRKRLVRLDDLPSDSPSRGGKEKEKKSKGKGRATNSGQWEPAIKLAKDATIGDIEVSRYLAERITPPVDERIMDKKSNLELGSQLVRLGIRSAAMSFAVLQRLETLDQEVQDLHEQNKALKDELSGVKEERDLFQAQNTSLEEEKKSREDTMGALKAQLASGEEERNELKKTVREERKLSKLYRKDCHSAVEGRDRAEKALQEMRGSIKKQRVEAIKRWKRRNLNAECLELACDVALSVLRKCHEIHVPDGSERPSFEDYAEPLLPALGLSLGEMKEKALEVRTVVPDEELDRSSEEEEEGEEEDEDASPLSPPPDPTVGPSSADPVVGPSSPLADPATDPSSPPDGSG